MAAGHLAQDYSSAIDDVALGIDTNLVVHLADTADFGDMPDFTERFLIAFSGGLHLQFLEAVFTAVLTRM